MLFVKVADDRLVNLDEIDEIVIGQGPQVSAGHQQPFAVWFRKQALTIAAIPCKDRPEAEWIYGRVLGIIQANLGDQVPDPR